MVGWVEVGEAHGGYELCLSTGVVGNLIEGILICVEGKRVTLL